MSHHSCPTPTPSNLEEAFLILKTRIYILKFQSIYLFIGFFLKWSVWLKLENKGNIYDLPFTCSFQFYFYLYVSLYVYAMYMESHRDQKKTSDALDLELKGN